MSGRDSAILPSLLIIGAQKAGTSSLHSWLDQHPGLTGYERKEAHYFDGGIDYTIDTYGHGPDWYASLFSGGLAQKAGAAAFESTPLYMFNPLVPARIKSLLPCVRMVAILRDPVERAISHYYHVVQRNREHLPLDEALRVEEERLAPVLESGDYKHPNFIRFSYKKRGLYSEQLERYFDLFDRDQMLVISSQELFGDPVKTVGRVLRHAGINGGTDNIVFDVKNAGKIARKPDDDEREYLSRYFRRANERLYDLLGQRFPWT